MSALQTLNEEWPDNPAIYMDLETFSREVIGHTNICDMHREWYKILEDESKKYVCILAPPEHGKSDTVGITYALWKLLRNQEIRILNVAAVEAQSKRQVGATFEHFERFYPHLRGMKAVDSWGASKFTLDRKGVYQEASYTALGLAGSGIVGGHWNEIIPDDLVTQANSKTAHQRGETEDFVRRTLIGRLAPGGRMIIIGSRWHEDDFYKLIIDQEKGDPGLLKRFWGEEGIVKVYQAIDEWEDEENRIPSKLAWPELIDGDGGWTLEEMAGRWQFMGELHAQFQLQNNPQPAVGKMLKGDWIHTFRWEDLPAPGKLSHVAIGLDPAFSTEEPGDWCAAGVVCKDYLGQLYLWDVATWHVTFTDFLTEHLTPWYEKIQGQITKDIPNKISWRIILEVNSLGGKNEFRANFNRYRELGLLGQLPIIPITTKSNKVSRIGTRAAFYQNGSILVREDLKRIGNDFYDQWLGFPEAKHDDALDAPDFALEYLLSPKSSGIPRTPPQTGGDKRTSMRDRRRHLRRPDR